VCWWEPSCDPWLEKSRIIEIDFYRRSENVSTDFFSFFLGNTENFSTFHWFGFFKSLTFISGLCRGLWLIGVAIKMKCQVGAISVSHQWFIFCQTFSCVNRNWPLTGRTNRHHLYSRNLATLLVSNVSITTRAVCLLALELSGMIRTFITAKGSGSCAYTSHWWMASR
jgi:hypothetical protein